MLDGSPIIHQGFCRPGGESQSDGEDEERSRRSTPSTLEDWWAIWVQTEA